MSAVEFRLSRSLDVDSAAGEFQRSGRVRILDVLEPACAEALYNCLVKDVPWRLAYSREGRPMLLDAAEARALSREQQQQLAQRIVDGARAGFQYVYSSYPMVTAYLQGQDPGLLLHRLLEWLATPEVLDTVRRITGIPTLRKCDGQATLYQAGHFLTQHDDRGSGSEQRRVGYVLNLTRGWRADWGGLLHFLSEDGQQVRESWIPGYNVLALFRVPVLHAVSYVAPYATQPRLAVTGWFRDD
jgi:Rps23 Pro-64 3,4-dihydroxylase Tpa1-like proline 4-hydroxylase